MSLRHVVMFRWADHVDAQMVSQVTDELSKLPAVVESIRDYSYGADIGLAEGNYDYVVVATFDDVDGWRAYRDHPDHVAMIESHIKNNITERVAVQYEVH